MDMTSYTSLFCWNNNLFHSLSQIYYHIIKSIMHKKKTFIETNGKLIDNKQTMETK